MFITFEGIDGSGKSTQISLLKDFLEENGQRVILTREPGGTPAGEKIRNILLDRNNVISDRSEMFLYAACRAQLVRDVIRPALHDGMTVICDRFLDSSIAYQAFGRQLGSMVQEINGPAVDGCIPDLTFLLDVPVGTGRERVEEQAEPDRLESEKDAFFQRVRNGYLKIAEREPDRVFVLDGTGEVQDIQSAIQSITKKRWK
ncbi:MAG: dTMP kinase [Eubacterium sp.]